MDWGLIFPVTLAVLGVALMVGGIVAYRGSPIASSFVRIAPQNPHLNRFRLKRW